MRLPEMPYKLGKLKRETVAMGNINYSDATRDGDLADSYGISANRWPYIATRWARKQTVTPGDTTAIFSWDGHRVRVTGGVLYYDDKALDNVRPGPKQFSVVGNKLIVWPDMTYIDLSDNSFVHMNAIMTASGATIAGDTITAGLDAIIERGVSPNRWEASPTASFNPGVYTYGNNPKAISISDGKWNLPTPKKAGFWGGLEEGDILIPEKTRNSFDWVWADFYDGELPDTSKYNTEGYYGVITRSDWFLSIEETSWAEAEFDVYKKGVEGLLFSGILSIGDPVKMTGTLAGYADFDHSSVASMRDDPNSLTVSPAMRIPSTYYKAASDLQPGLYSITDGAGQSHGFKTLAPIKNGSYIFYREAKEVDVWDEGTKKVLQTYKADLPAEGAAGLTGTAYPKENLTLTVQRDIPDMDYICSSGNRLWGCSNKDHAIYASALGNPINFWDFTGESTDSYQVAVGSEGKFTGCCAFGNAVLFWKEDRMHKVLGSYPAEYSVSESMLDGVQEGSYKSLQVVDGALYYLGTHGVYQYAGGAPRLMSPNFGNKVFSNGVGGSDGDTYYLTVKEGGKKHLFEYETRQHMWVREDSLCALDFARIGRDLRMLVDDGAVYSVTTHEEEPLIPWMAQFAPIRDSIEGRKTYNQLIVRVQVPEKSRMWVKARWDDGPWKEVAAIRGKDNDAIPIKLPMARCDKIEIRLEGEGPCTILGILREYRVGSEH